MKQMRARLREIWTDLSRGAEGNLPRLGFLVAVDVLGAALILALLLGLRFIPARIAVRRTAAQQERAAVSTPLAQETASPTMAPESTPAVTAEPTAAEKRPTAWQLRFAEHFSDTPILTENSYHSPEVSIEITEHERLCEYGRAVYYVADIYVASLENFKTTTANGRLEYTATMHAEELDAQANAILAINGDFLSLSDSGFYVRNGEIYRSDMGKADICVLCPDGSMETWQANSFSVEEILARDPLQVWQFGPSLLDAEGHARKELLRVVNVIGMENPRAAMGYYEPGHYCFVVVDGRNGRSVGIRLLGLAKIFEELGCSCAYNLDGGGSTVLMFNHKVYNDRSSRRTIGDLILVTEEGFPPAKDGGG